MRASSRSRLSERSRLSIACPRRRPGWPPSQGVTLAGNAAGGAQEGLLDQELVLRRAVWRLRAAQGREKRDELALVHLLAGDGRQRDDLLAGRVLPRRLGQGQANGLAGVERLGDGAATGAVDLEAAGVRAGLHRRD